MSPERIYTNPEPLPPFTPRSTFTFAWPPPASDPYPPSTPAFIDAVTGKTLTRGDVRTLALQLAWSFRRLRFPRSNAFGTTHGETDGLARGDVVLLLGPNALAWPLTLYAAQAAGLRCALVNPTVSAAELAFFIDNSTAKVLFVAPALVQLAQEGLEEIGLGTKEARARIVAMDYGAEGDDVKGVARLSEMIGKGALEEEEKFDGADAEETAFLCYSSGTTGKPKGVMTTHRNIIANSIMNQYALHHLKYGHDVLLGVLPLFHIFGLQSILHHMPSVGIPVLLVPRFEPSAFLKYMEQYKITVSFVVPPILLALLQHPDTEKTDLRRLRTLMSGAAPLGGPLVRGVTDRLHKAGATDIAIIQGYGLTETSPTATVLDRADAIAKVGSVGRLVRGVEARLVHHEDAVASKLPRGADEGELWLRGPSIMKGYWRNAEASAHALTPDGWFKTGDVARREPDGNFWIVDRVKELIKYKGFQVAPAELESLLLTHPHVADVAVIGVEAPEHATELPRAYIVPAPGKSSKKLGAEIEAWVRSRVANHKRLRGGVALVDVIPKSVSGKILRRELRDRAKAERVADPPRAKM